MEVKDEMTIEIEEKQIIEKETEVISVLPSESQRKSIRKGILKLQEAMFKMPKALIGDSPEYLAVCPLTHTFADRMYIRQISMPKGMVFITKIHKFTHPYFMLKGDCSVLTEEGVKRIKAPFSGITSAGTKRVIYTHEDTIWITVHATKETDLVKIEEEVIAKSYAELGIDVDEKTEEIKLLEFIEEVSKGEVV